MAKIILFNNDILYAKKHTKGRTTNLGSTLTLSISQLF